MLKLNQNIKNVKEVGVVLKNGNILWSQQLHQLQSLVLSVLPLQTTTTTTTTDHTNNKASEDVRDEIRRRLSMGTSNKPTLLVRDGDDKSITAKHLRDLKI